MCAASEPVENRFPGGDCAAADSGRAGAHRRAVMFRQVLMLPVLILLMSMSQACEATRVSDTDGVNPMQNARSDRTAGSSVPQSRRAAFAASPYQPSGLWLYADFQGARVNPVRGREERYARLDLNSPLAGSTAFGITYEGGSLADRYARIAPDPEDAANEVLHYWIKNARVPGQKKVRYKARIQMNLSNMNLDSVFQRYRMYLHPDLELYRRFPEENGWFTVNELWMGARWKKHPFPFRIGVGIAKPRGAGRPLYFIVSGDVSAGGPIGKGNWRSLWSKFAGHFEVPIGEWLDVELGYKSGDDSTGRFYMGIKRERDKSFTTLFDLRNRTYHPDSPQPVGLTDWQPLKLYTNSRIIDFVRKGGGVTQIYFDNLEIYSDW